jgi:hypothetical protein
VSGARSASLHPHARRASSNSPPSVKTGGFGGEAFEAGVDTLALSGALRDEASVLAIKQPGLVHHRVKSDCWRVQGPESWGLWPGPSARLFYFERSQLLRIEGHPSGVSGLLASPDDIPGYAEALLESLAAVGVRVREPIGVARCDGTVTLAYDRPLDGLAVLAGVAAIKPPRLKINAHRGDVLETVYYETATGRKRARWYDSGRKHETAAPGLNIRAEDQRLYDRSSRRLDARKVTTANVRQAFRDRFVTLAKATEGVTVAGVPVIVEKVARRVRQGSCTTSRAEKAIAFSLLSRAGCGDVYATRTAERRRALLREEGLVLLEGELAPVEVDLGAVLEAALDRGVWGCG